MLAAPSCSLLRPGKTWRGNVQGGWGEAGGVARGGGGRGG